MFSLMYVQQDAFNNIEKVKWDHDFDKEYV